MLILEDEREILASGSGVLIPILVNQTDGDTEIEAYRGIEAIAADFHARFPGKYFTNAAIDWLDERLRPYVEGLGYLRECTGKYRWYIRYELTDPSALPLERIRPDSRPLTGGDYDDYDVKVSFSLIGQMEKDLPAYVTLIGGKIVSIATVNEHAPGQKLLEITVETAPGYRGQGYALSNTVALAADLTRRGFRTAYVASRYNRASRKIADRAGFARLGRIYAYTAYKL